MKTSIKLLGASVLMLAASTAFAEPAIILTDFGCGMVDGDGNGVWTTDTKVSSSVNKKGTNVNFKCFASGVANSTGKTVKWNSDDFFGQPCGTQFGSSDDWRIVVDMEGNAVMSCKIHF
jgi:hypothetical protein